MVVVRNVGPTGNSETVIRIKVNKVYNTVLSNISKRFICFEHSTKRISNYDWTGSVFNARVK